MEIQIRQQTLEKELSLMKDTIWRLQGRIYTLETFLKEKFGEIVVDFGLRLLNSANPQTYIHAGEHVVSEVFQQSQTGERHALEELTVSNRNTQTTVHHPGGIRTETGQPWQQTILEQDLMRDASTSEPTTVSIGEEFVVIPQDSKFCINDLSVGANVIAEVEPAACSSKEDKITALNLNTPINSKRKKKSATEVTEYKCAPCNRSFTFEWRYKAHLLQHSGSGKAPKPVTRPYICEYCNKKFINKNVLQVHIRIHTGEKPYKCSVCDKAFSQSSSCKTHMRIHTKEKPYKCKECKASFAHSQNLHKHVQSTHQ